MKENSILARLVHSRVNFLVIEGKDKFSDLGVRDWFLCVDKHDISREKELSKNFYYVPSKDERDCMEMGFKTKTMSDRDHNYFRVNKEKFYLDKSNELANFYKLIR